MDEIKIVEYEWGWELDIPCVKCGKMKCAGTSFTLCERVGIRWLNPSRDRANNIKEALDICMEWIAKRNSQYCSNRSN